WNVYRDELQITPAMCYNIEKVTSIIQRISNEASIKEKNAKITINDGLIELNPHINGYALDVDLCINRIENALVNRQWNDIELCVVKTAPQVTSQLVENIGYKLGGFETTFNINNEARVHNIKNACNRINQSLLLPQQEFSMDKALGDRTEKNGYKQARVIINNEYVDGLGGGICQVTSTVYNTVLLSGLVVLERRNHTLPASYIDVGRDATISQGYIDLRFKNTSDYSVLIEAKTKEDKLSVVFWGIEPVEKTSFMIRTKIIQVIEAQGVEAVVDPLLKAGEIEVLRQAKPGYKVEVYRDTLDKSGKVIETEKISVDSYLPQKMKIKTGGL
ncbi:MAG TPA: VanW family protein, partial [Thermoclostridium sp.]|nr:VanW family protein [Thermoclostridium sp.]